MDNKGLNYAVAVRTHHMKGMRRGENNPPSWQFNRNSVGFRVLSGKCFASLTSKAELPLFCSNFPMEKNRGEKVRVKEGGKGVPWYFAEVRQGEIVCEMERVLEKRAISCRSRYEHVDEKKLAEVVMDQCHLGCVVPRSNQVRVGEILYKIAEKNAKRRILKMMNEESISSICPIFLHSSMPFLDMTNASRSSFL